MLEKNNSEREMKVKFVGATEGVTGSCSLLEFTDSETKSYIMVDCGMEQGNGARNEKTFPFDVSKINWVFLTHAHLDHCGRLPLLYKSGYKGKVFCTKATADITREILLDSAKISTLYTKEDVEKIKFSPVDEEGRFKFGKQISLRDNLRYYFKRSSHILGAVQISFRWFANDDTEHSISFTGDLGSTTDDQKKSLLLKDNMIPFNNDKGNDFIVSESTYGGKESKEFCAQDRLDILSSLLDNEFTTTSEIKTLIFPAFSLHRTHEVLLDLLTVFENKSTLITAPFDYEYLLDSLNKNEFRQNVVDAYKYEYADELIIFGELEKSFYIKNIKKLSLNSLEELKIRFKLLRKKINIDLSLISPLATRLLPIYKRELNNTIMKKGEIKHLYSNVGEYGYPTKEFIDRVYKSPEFKNSKAKSSKIGSFGQCNYSIKKEYKCKSNDHQNKIIISSSGMCQEGMVSTILPHHLSDPNTTICLTGYQAKETTGYVLLNLEYTKDNKPEDYLYNSKLPGYDIRLSEIKCKILNLSSYYSGHAGQQDIIEYLFDNPVDERTEPVKVFLNHGENESKKALASIIDDRNSSLSDEFTKTIIPREEDSKNWYNLNTESWEVFEHRTKLVEMNNELTVEGLKINIISKISSSTDIEFLNKIYAMAI